MSDQINNPWAELDQPPKPRTTTANSVKATIAKPNLEAYLRNTAEHLAGVALRGPENERDIARTKAIVFMAAADVLDAGEIPPETNVSDEGRQMFMGASFLATACDGLVDRADVDEARLIAKIRKAYLHDKYIPQHD